VVDEEVFPLSSGVMKPKPLLPNHLTVPVGMSDSSHAAYAEVARSDDCALAPLAALTADTIRADATRLAAPETGQITRAARFGRLTGQRSENHHRHRILPSFHAIVSDIYQKGRGGLDVTG
jgi:hypothetical protein